MKNANYKIFKRLTLMSLQDNKSFTISIFPFKIARCKGV